MSGTRTGRAPRPGIPLLALLRRDLTGASRGASLLWGRTLAMLSAGALVLIAYAVALGEGAAAQIGAVGGVFVVHALLAIGLLLAPGIAVTALRREREAGMLDLLLLAGITPRTLVLGRVLSSFLFLESLLVAALPATALFWFFRRPTPFELLQAAAVLTASFLAISAMAVAVSAWSRNAGLAVALTIILLGAWLGAGIVAAVKDGPAPITLLAHVMGLPTPGTTAAHPLRDGILVHGGIAVLFTGLAVRGMTRRRVAATRDVLLERIEKRRRGVDDRWPLTWLVRRGSAPARPGVLAIVLGIPAALAALAGAEVGLLAGAALAVVSWIVAAVAGATVVAPARERRTWDSLLTTAMTGDRLIGDLLHAVLATAAVPLGLAAVLQVGSAARAGLGLEMPLLAVAAQAATTLLCGVAGLGASIAARSAGGAIALVGAFLLVEPLLGCLGYALVEALGRGPLEVVTRPLLVLAALAAAAAMLAARRSGPLRVVAGTVAAACAVLALGHVAISFATRAEARDFDVVNWWATGVGAGFATLGVVGMVRFRQGGRRGALGRRLGGLVLVAATLVLPLCMAAVGDDADAIVAAWGGAGSVLAVLDVAFQGGDDVASDVLSLRATLAAVAHHVALALAFAWAAWRRRDAYLGRADAA